MNIQNDKPLTIYVKEYGERKYYKVGISKKKQDGTYENGYVDVQFKKGVEIENKEKIYFKNAFLTFYKNKDNKTIPYIMVLDYDKVEDVIEKEHIDVKKEVEPSDDLFAEFGKETEDVELPF